MVHSYQVEDKKKSIDFLFITFFHCLKILYYHERRWLFYILYIIGSLVVQEFKRTCYVNFRFILFNNG